MLLSRRKFLKQFGVISLAGFACNYPVFIERYLIETNYYKIPVPNLPKQFHGLRIVHLSDFHYGLLQPLVFVKHVIDRANRLNPDLIVCTGDYVHSRRTTDEIDTVWPELLRLRAPLGVFSVLGNHDHWASTERSLHWLDKSGQGIHHKVVPITRNGQRIWLIGAGDFWEDHRDLDKIIGEIPSSECTVVLAHNPDTADTMYNHRINLFLCGHTHGGQVRVPFWGAPVLPVRNKSYDCGLCYTDTGIPIFISRGIGWAILPVRFNCLPEIAVLELVGVNV